MAICIAWPLQAQTPRSTDFKFQHVSVELGGLSQCSVNVIFQDSRGFLWFGTADGLNRYDGYSFKYYKHDPGDTNSLSYNNVNGIAEDRNGTLWFGTGGEGLNKFDRKSGKFTRYKHRQNDALSLSNDYIHDLYCDALGTIWIGTYAGLNAFDPETEKFIRYQHDPQNPQKLGHPYVRRIYEDRKGALWIIAGAVLHNLNSRTGLFKRYALAPPSGPDVHNGVTSIYEDQGGTFWVGTAHSGLVIFDREKERVTFHFQHDPRDSTTLMDNEVAAICEDVTGALWFGTRTGVNRWDRVSGKFLRFRHDPQNSTSVSYGNCTSIYGDRSNLMWFATDGSGLSKLDPRPPKFAHHRHEPGNRNSLSLDLPKSICEDRDGDVWIGTNHSGVDRYDRRTGKMTNYRHDPGDPSTIPAGGVTAICADRDGILWLGCHGLNRCDRERGRFAHPGNAEGRRLALPREIGNAICEDHEGKLWVGGEGLSRYDKDTRQTISYQHQPENPASLSSKPVTVIYEDRRGVLWVGTHHGLNKFNRADKTFTRYFHDPSSPNSLGNDYIKAIFEDGQGNLWIGTTDGLNKLDPETEAFTRYYEKDGLPSSFIYGILGDDRGNLWLSTNGGLSKFNPAAGRFRNYALKDGLQSFEFNTGAYHCSKRTGEMFFGGINGVNAFHPDSVNDSRFVPPIVFTDFKKFDLPVKLAAEVADLDAIELAYEENVFSFEFAALDYTHPGNNQYAYMLEGFDKDWVYCGVRRFARYTNLDPGSYTFKVKGTNHDGVWNEQGSTLEISIVPPFWMTRWFRTLAVALILSAVAGAAKYVSVRKFRNRVEELERQQALENERKRISQDMHDELGANLTKIAILSDLAQKDLSDSYVDDASFCHSRERGNPEIKPNLDSRASGSDSIADCLRNSAPSIGAIAPIDLQARLQKMSEIARATIDNMSEIIWAINPQHNTLDSLAAYLRKYAANYLEMTPVQYRLDFPEHVPGYPISAEFRRHVFMVVKEALHNVIKHAQATQMEMKLVSCDHTLEIVIQDNGKGFDTKKINEQGNGVPNMNKRMAEVGGKFEIASQAEGGTQVRIWAKLKSSLSRVKPL